MNKIPVGISSCLLGKHVRYDGGHKLNTYITGTLSNYFEFHPFCPEVEIGMGTPRPPIRLLKIGDAIHCVTVNNPREDFTVRLRSHAQHLSQQHAQLCGYILKKGSPSCGMEKVRVFNNNIPQTVGIGIYAHEMMRINPLLPVEDETRLGEMELRNNFIERVFVFYRWKLMLQQGLTRSRLMEFHARHELIIMSHDDYHDLKQLLAKLKQENITQIAEQYFRLLMNKLRKPSTRCQHVNVLRHIQSLLIKQLSPEEKTELNESIER